MTEAQRGKLWIVSMVLLAVGLALWALLWYVDGPDDGWSLMPDQKVTFLHLVSAVQFICLAGWFVTSVIVAYDGSSREEAASTSLQIRFFIAAGAAAYGLALLVFNTARWLWGLF